MLNSHGNPIQVRLVALPLVAWGLERLMESAHPRLALAGSSASVAECLQALPGCESDVLLLDLDGEDGTESLAELHGRTRDRKSTRLNSSHIQKSRMPSSA